MAIIEGVESDPFDQVVADAYVANIIERANAERLHSAATAVSNLSFAWKVLQYDVDNGIHQFVPASESNRTAISRDYALWTKQDEGALVSIVIGSRVKVIDAELEVRASGPRAKDMSINYYEFNDPQNLHSVDVRATKIHKPYNDFERIRFADRATALAGFFSLPLRKRNAISRYDRRHPQV